MNMRYEVQHSRAIKDQKRAKNMRTCVAIVGGRQSGVQNDWPKDSD